MKGNELYHQWQELAAANPYLVARKELGLTQEQVADRVDVTPQYIRRHEQGTVNTPSGSLNELYGLYANQFYLWVDRMRSLIKPAVEYSAKGRVLTDFAVGPEHPFNGVMEGTVRAIGRYFEVPVRLSSNEFTRYTVQHPRNWQLYLKSGHARMPYELAKVCELLGMPVLEIEEGVNLWLKSL